MNEERRELKEERKELRREEREDPGLTTASILGAGKNEELRRERSEEVATPAAVAGGVLTGAVAAGSAVRQSAQAAGSAAQRAVGTAAGAATAAAPALAREEHRDPLIAESEVANLRQRWDAIQVSFVDEPRKAVEHADHLVAEAMKRIAEVFANERSRLEGQWDRGDNVSTEDLRVALQRYRSFFGRLLSI